MDPTLPPAPPDQEEGLVRAIGARALAANVVNLTVGAGIFVLPAAVAGVLGPSAVFAYVVCGGVMGLVLLCIAACGSRVTRTGGTYAYVEAAFGPFAGFLAGTVQWFVLGVLANAAVASVLVETVARAIPALAQPFVRAAALAVLYTGLALIQSRGVRQGARVATGLTLVKLVPLLLLVAVGLPAVRAEAFAGMPLPSMDRLGEAALLLFFAFAGPESALGASGEIRHPARTVPRGILLGAVGVVALYVGLQTVAQGVLGPGLADATAAPLADAAGRVLGPFGVTLLLVGAALSTFGLVGGDLLSSPRPLFAAAHDGFFVSALARVHPRFRTPHVAIAAYAALAFGFAATGAFASLAAVTSAGLLVVYLAVCASAVVLQRRDVRGDGVPFRLPGGPLIPLLGAGFVVWVLTHVTLREVVALGLLLVVTALLYALRRKPPQDQAVEG